MKKLLSILISILFLPIMNCSAQNPKPNFPSNFSKDGFIFSRITDEEYSNFSKFLNMEGLNVYTVKCEEQGNSVIGQIAFSYPKINEMTNKTISYFVCKHFAGHDYEHRASNAFMDMLDEF